MRPIKFITHELFNFDNDWDIHKSSQKSARKSGYMHNMELVIFLKQLCFAYPTRSGCKGGNARSRPIYHYLVEHLCMIQFVQEGQCIHIGHNIT